MIRNLKLSTSSSRKGEVMKYRRNKVKREHGIIQDALTWLEELSRCPEVTDIIPGVIEVSRSPERGIVYKYETQTGCKILLKSNGSIQEAFVVTKSPDFVRQWVENRFSTVSDKKLSETNDNTNEVKPNRKEQTRIKQGSSNLKSNTHAKSHSKSNSVTGTTRTRSPKSGSNKSSRSDRGLEEKYLLGDPDLPSLGQRINAQAQQALRALQKDLKQPNTRRKK